MLKTGIGLFRRLIIFFPILFQSCTRPIGHGKYIVSYRGDGPNSNGALLLNLNANNSHGLCGGQHSCIEAYGGQFTADILLLHANEVMTGSPAISRLFIWNNVEGSPLVPLVPDNREHIEGTGSLSPDGKLICFIVMESDYKHSSVWLKNRESGILQKVTDVTAGNQWYAYPNWTGDSRSITYSLASHSKHSVQIQVLKYNTEAHSIQNLEFLANTVSYAYAPGSDNTVVAWTDNGLELFNASGNTHTILLPIAWCKGRRLRPNTLTWDKSGQFVLFSVYDPSKKVSELFQLSIEDNGLKKVFSLKGVTITALSATL